MILAGVLPKQLNDWLFLGASIAILAGLVLSIISWLEICTIECTEVHFYRYFGMKFEYMGLLFFVPLLIIHVMSRWNPGLSTYAGLMLAGAVGSEIYFIMVQKFQIGSWCPVCLSIATCVGIAAFCYLMKYLNEFITYYKQGQRREFMKTIWKGFAGSSMLVLGFLVSVLGISRFDQIQAAENTIKESLFFGDKSSPIEVYVFTDWACPACRTAEPILEESGPEIMKKAKLTFVDFAIHTETLNYSPYNVSFMIKNKPEYFRLREALTKLSLNTPTPTDEQIEKLAQKLGVKYQQLNFADITLSQKYFKQLATQFSVDRTPSIIIINTKTKKGKKLIGGGEITEEKILNAIDSLK